MRLFICALVAMVAVCSGCATRQGMAFEGQQGAEVEASKYPTFLLAVAVKNTHKKFAQPKLVSLHVERLLPSGEIEKINFAVGENVRIANSQRAGGFEYLISFRVPTGRYLIRGFNAVAGVFPVLGHFFLPMHAPFEVNVAGVHYLGRVNARVRERVGNEFRAGAILPVAQQAMVGASTGTFDIEVTDAFAHDLPHFINAHSQLGEAEVRKAVLPPFERARAQTYWQEGASKLPPGQ